MDSSADKQAEGASPAPEDVVERWVSEFIARREQARTLTPEEFAGAVPEELRARVIEHCRSYLMALPHLSAEAQAPLDVPAVLGGYLVVRLIGRGGMGSVYEARSRDGTAVALKVLHPHLAVLPESVARFTREDAAARRLDHPSIVKVLASGQDGPWHFLVLELVRGTNLSDLLAREERALAPARAAEIARAVAAGLAHAHEHGVVHRDVTPRNVFLADDGRVLIGDFGLAQVAESSALTRPGQVLGTACYMSPEQALASRVKVDHRTDVYSLGVVLYELLTGRRPFDAPTSHDLLWAITFRDPVRPRLRNPSVPRDLESICLQAMEKRPDDRYQSAAELEGDLEHFLRHEAVRAQPRPLWWVVWRRVQRRPQRPLLATAALAALLAAGWAYRLGIARNAVPPAHLALAPQASLAGVASWIHALDPLSHARRDRSELDLAPGGTVDVPRGLVRITFERRDADGDAFAELTRFLEPDSRLELDPRLLSTSSVVDDMVLVPAGTYRVGHSEPHPHYAAEVRIGAFWIDRCEVTNAEYHQYLEAVPGATRPRNWPADGLPAAWEALPVIGIRFLDARAYAEWRGKRLPTWIEWEIAATGPDARGYPWGDDGQDLRGKAVVARLDERASQGDLWLGYERLVVPADEPFGEDRSAFGVLHAFGNVREWTESHLLRDPEHPEELVSWQQLAKGHSWQDRADQLVPLGFLQDAPNDIATHIGFRCAKSADAPALFDPQYQEHERR